MDRAKDWIHLYIGCETNKGRLVGVVGDKIFIQESAGESPNEFDRETLGNSVFLKLRRLANMSDEQSVDLIKKGFSIGRPSGYSFSNDAVLYLLSQSVDLFGFIAAGLAIDTTNDHNQ